MLVNCIMKLILYRSIKFARYERFRVIVYATILKYVCDLIIEHSFRSPYLLNSFYKFFEKVFPK